MMATKRSAGVAPKVNLRNPFHLGEETHDRRHQKSKTGVSVDPQKELMSSKNYFKKKTTRYLEVVEGGDELIHGISE